MFQMHSRVIALVTAAFIVPATVVLACEGECIVGITNALLGNYTRPMNRAFIEIVNIYSSFVVSALMVFFSRTMKSIPRLLAQSLPRLLPSSAPFKTNTSSVVTITWRMPSSNPTFMASAKTLRREKTPRDAQILIAPSFVEHQDL